MRLEVKHQRSLENALNHVPQRFSLSFRQVETSLREGEVGSIFRSMAIVSSLCVHFKDLHIGAHVVERMYRQTLNRPHLVSSARLGSCITV